MSEKKYNIIPLLGAAFLVSSAATIIEGAVKIAKSKKNEIGKLAAGLVGAVIGAALVTDNERRRIKGLVVEEILDEGDVELIKANIGEILGNAADRGENKTKFKKIEVDEETSIEDFIEKK